MKGAVVPGLTLALAGCAASDPFERTEIGRMRQQIYQSRTVHDVLVQPGRDFSMAGQLGDAAFAMTRGLDRDGAMAKLQADGAVCDGGTCLWTSVVKEAGFPCGVPPVWLVSMCVRPAGPRRTFEVVREVRFLAPRVRDRADVSAVVRQGILE